MWSDMLVCSVDEETDSRVLGNGVDPAHLVLIGFC